MPEAKLIIIGAFIAGVFTITGNIIGVTIAYYFSRTSQANTARFELIEHLSNMIHKFRWSRDHSLDFILKVYIENDVLLRVKYSKFRTFIWPCKRERLRKAWIKCMGEDEKTSKPGIPCAITPETIEAARDQLSELLGTIEKI